MRVLVACSDCQRQYDATKLAPRSQFHCACGAAVTVAPPRGHDAAVVRCASCGAPRENQAAHCGHCRADFTLHEQDLHTVCPRCFARVSDRAQFCHHCATPLVGDLVAGEPTSFTCPACRGETLLCNRKIARVAATVHECQSCAGLWVGISTLHHIFDLEAARDREPVVKHRKSPPQGKAGYRPCVECGALMQRRNFGLGQSGVVVDLCGDHGLWFDAHEFAQLIAWVRAGGLEAARRDLARLKNSPDVVRRTQLRREATERTRPKPILPPSSSLRGDMSDTEPTDLFDLTLTLIAKLFQ